jgi:hypothetical protein
VSHLCVYITGGILDNIIFGDQLSSLLRVIPVTGKAGEIKEMLYESPVLSKVLTKDISEIGIEIRSMEGRPIMFDYGVVIITLVFKRLINF